MTTEELKQAIEKQTGIPAALIAADTAEGIIGQARSLLAYRQDLERQREKTTREQFAEWARDLSGMEEPDTASAALEEIAEAARKAAEIVTMYRNRLDQLENDGTALITEAEYKELQAGILEEITALQRTGKERLSVIAEELRSIHDNMVNVIEAGNAALYDLQIDVYKMQDMPLTLKYNAKMNPRPPYILDTEQRIYKDWSFVDFLHDLIVRLQTAGYIQ